MYNYINIAMKTNLPIIRRNSLAPTALVCGGAGFIGSHLAEALILKNANVVVLDNFSTGKKEYLSNLINTQNFTLIDGDINNGIPENIESVDYIFHLASTESYIYSENTITLDSLLTNALGTKNLLDLAKKVDAKFLLVSSNSVFQGQIGSYDMAYYFGKNTYDENKYTHSEAKRFAEALVFEYYKKHGIDARIVRLPEIYGPRMDFDSCKELGRLLKLLLKNQDLTIFGDGLEKNYYLYIADTVSGIIKAQFTKESKGKIYSLTPQETVSTVELAYLLKALSNGRLGIDFKEAKNILQKDITLNTKETNKELKWEQKILLKEGVSKTLRWYNYELNPYPFKPAIFIERAKEEKKEAEKITSLASNITPNPSTCVEKKQEAISTLIDFSEENKKPPQNTGILRAPQLPHVILSEAKNLGIKKQLLLSAIIAVLTALIFFGVIPAAQCAYYTNTAIKEFEKTTQYINRLDIQNAHISSEKSQKYFKAGNEKLSKIGWLFILFNQEERIRNYAKAIKVADYVSKAVLFSIDGADPVIKVFENVKPSINNSVVKDDLNRAVNNFDGAKQELERAQAEIEKINYDYFNIEVKTKLEKVKLEIPQIIIQLANAKKITSEIPEIFGYDSTKSYLILFQNPMELRSNGGFIGSYASVSLEKGKIKQIVIDDIYNIDGQLDIKKINTPSQTPIKTFLKQDYLRIRDANWSADFPESAKIILNLFGKGNGSKFDGVIAIDTFMVRDLLKIFGPVYLTSYNEEINSENIYERAQFYSEADYTNGSQQKKAFLTTLGSKLLETIFSSEKVKSAEVAKVVFENLNTKHILVYLLNTKLTSLILENNWGGNINSTKGDFVYIIDNNLGANKADYFIKRSYEYSIKNTYRDGALEVNLTLNYEHTGKNNNWPGGPYTDYFRVVVPKESFLHKAVVTNNGKEKEITKDVITGNEAGKRTFEQSFILNPKETVKIVLNYTLPKEISLNKGENIYNLYWQKQPGTDATPFSISFDEPFGRKITKTTPEFKKENGTFTYSGALLTDFSTSIVIK